MTSSIRSQSKSMEANHGFQTLDPHIFDQVKVYWKAPPGPAPTPAVLLMHELTGMTDELLDFADRIVESGFTVYLPLMFGEIGQPTEGVKGQLSTIGFSVKLCISREFYLFRSGASSPITQKLRQLCQAIYPLQGHDKFPGIGAVGLCMSGGFVLSLMLENHPSWKPHSTAIATPLVQAPVACHPALPSGKFKPSKESELDISAKDLEEVKQRVEQTQLLLVRFEEDQISPQARENRFKDEFKANLKTYSIPTETRQQEKIPSAPPNRPHSVLAGEYADPSGKAYPSTEAASDQVMLFLKERLSRPQSSQ